MRCADFTAPWACAAVDAVPMEASLTTGRVRNTLGVFLVAAGRRSHKRGQCKYSISFMAPLLPRGMTPTQRVDG